VPEPVSELATASAAERRRIRQQYEAAHLTENQATLALLRLDLAERRANNAALLSDTP